MIPTSPGPSFVTALFCSQLVVLSLIVFFSMVTLPLVPFPWGVLQADEHDICGKSGFGRAVARFVPLPFGKPSTGVGSRCWAVCGIVYSIIPPFCGERGVMVVLSPPSRRHVLRNEKRLDRLRSSRCVAVVEYATVSTRRYHRSC
jgi:hypothetical protein